MGFSCDKAEIIGLLCSEGSFTKSMSRYYVYNRKRNGIYLKNKFTKYIQFANSDYKLLVHFRNLIKREYNYSVNIEKDRIRICKRFIIKDLLKYSDYGHLKWNVPSQIFGGSVNIKISFLRGYFDGDGTSSSIARFFSTNKFGLLNVSVLLDNLQVRHTFQGPILKEGKKTFLCSSDKQER
jgi:hypothetical protein